MIVDKDFYYYVVNKLNEIDHQIQYYSNLNQVGMPEFMVNVQVELQYQKHIYNYFLRNITVRE